MSNYPKFLKALLYNIIKFDPSRIKQNIKGGHELTSHKGFVFEKWRAILSQTLLHGYLANLSQACDSGMNV